MDDVKFTSLPRKAIIRDSAGSDDLVHVPFNQVIEWDHRWWHFSHFEDDCPVYVPRES